jgi:hypothetical protein
VKINYAKAALLKIDSGRKEVNKLNMYLISYQVSSYLCIDWRLYSVTMNVLFMDYYCFILIVNLY